MSNVDSPPYGTRVDYPVGKSFKMPGEPGVMIYDCRETEGDPNVKIVIGAKTHTFRFTDTFSYELGESKVVFHPEGATIYKPKFAIIERG
jgi:hypothetical protein